MKHSPFICLLPSFRAVGPPPPFMLSLQADERRIIEVRVERVYAAEDGDEPERPTAEESEDYDVGDYDEEEEGGDGGGQHRQGAEVGNGRVFAAGGGGGNGGKQRQA